MANSIDKGRIVTEIEGFGGVCYRSYCILHQFELPCQSGTILFIPVRSKTLQNLRILGIMLTSHQS